MTREERAARLGTEEVLGVPETRRGRRNCLPSPLEFRVICGVRVTRLLIDEALGTLVTRGGRLTRVPPALGARVIRVERGAVGAIAVLPRAGDPEWLTRPMLRRALEARLPIPRRGARPPVNEGRLGRPIDLLDREIPRDPIWEEERPEDRRAERDDDRRARPEDRVRPRLAE